MLIRTYPWLSSNICSQVTTNCHNCESRIWRPPQIMVNIQQGNPPPCNCCCYCFFVLVLLRSFWHTCESTAIANILYILYTIVNQACQSIFYMYVFVSFLGAWRCIIQYYFYQIGISSFIHNSWEQKAIKDCELSRTSLHKQPQSYFCLSSDVRRLK